MNRNFLLVISLILIPSVANAYIGPGLGVGIIGAIVGVFTAIFLGLFGLFWYPIKRLIRKHRPATETADEIESLDAEPELKSAEPSVNDKENN